MRSGRRLLFILGAIALVALLAWRTSGALRERRGGQGPAVRGTAAIVQVARAQRATLELHTTYVGEVTAASSVDVTPRVAGVVTDLVASEGQRVGRGQVLVRLDPRDLRLQVAQAQAAYDVQRVQVDAARASLQTQRARLAQVLAGPPAEQVRQAEEQLRQARAAVEFSREQLRRQEELFAQGYVSRQQVDAARLDIAVQEARLRTAEEQLALLQRDPRPEAVQIARALVEEAEVASRQAVTRLEQARISLQQARALLAESAVTAPVAGMVGKLLVERGQAVTTATPLVRLIDVDPAVIVVSVIERDLPRIRPGLEVLVRTDALPGEAFRGRITGVSPILATATRTAEVRIAVANPDGRLRPGMFANVDIQLARRENVIAVPPDAVLERNGGQVVIVIREQTAQVRAVRLGLSDGTLMEITEGLADGEVVAVAGHRTLRDGMPVTVPGTDGGRSRPGGAPQRP